MRKTVQLEDFYQERHTWMPEQLKKDIGHFNVFRVEEYNGPKDCVPYNRRDFYKISLLHGHTRFFYADRSIEFENSALLFSNPQIPYAWETDADNMTGFFCIFSETFFDQFAHIKEYPLFKPGDPPVFLLSQQQVKDISAIYGKMFDEIDSDFTYKYDVLRNLVLELIHSALKMQPAASRQYSDSNAATRVASLFTQLLERQFPIESRSQRMKLRTPSDFAGHLSVHVNHLNRSLKEITGKTTSQLIAERLIQEARALLRHTDWNISEIGWCLGFEELTHFIAFFKKSAGLTPKVFRKVKAV